MKQFEMPKIEILRLEISDILTASTELIGWDAYDNGSGDSVIVIN